MVIFKYLFVFLKQQCEIANNKQTKSSKRNNCYIIHIISHSPLGSPSKLVSFFRSRKGFTDFLEYDTAWAENFFC